MCYKLGLVQTAANRKPHEEPTASCMDRFENRNWLILFVSSAIQLLGGCLEPTAGCCSHSCKQSSRVYIC